MIRNCFHNIAIFISALLVCSLLLLAVCAVIPQSSITQSCRDAERYFSSHDGFPMLMDGVEGSRMDNYADCAIFDVIYYVDSEAAFRSVITAPYYRIEGNDIREDYRSAVIDGKAPNNEYSRYWHGSQVLLRPLLTFTSIEGCRAILFGILAAMNLLLLFLLVRRKAFLPMAAYLASLVAVQFWVTAFTLEYIMVFLVTTGACIAVTMFWSRDGLPEKAASNRKKGKLQQLENREAPGLERTVTRILIVSGVVTCFLDFLTAETLSFTVPVILALMLLQKSGGAASFRQQMIRMVKWGSAWLCSYATMFAVKWLLVLLVSGEAAFQNALDSAAVRIDGDTASVNGEVMDVSAIGALGRNIACLMPFSGDLTVRAVLGITLAVLAVLFAVFYLFRGKNLDVSYIVALLLVGLVPYLRFLCIFSHSFVHYFFTYRAQMAMIMALIAVMAYALKPSDVVPARKAGGKR